MLEDPKYPIDKIIDSIEKLTVPLKSEIEKKLL